MKTRKQQAASHINHR